MMRWDRWAVALCAVILCGLLVAGCGASAPSSEATAAATGGSEQASVDTIPVLTPLDLDGRKLQAVATTNIVGDAIKQVGGDHLELSTLLSPGTDPHAYQLTPSDRQLLEDADVIFINGLGLEEGMLPVLSELSGKVPVVPVGAGISTIELGGHEDDVDEHQHEGADPHSWQSVANVIVWTQNIADALSALDPANADSYAAAAAAYTAQLEALNSELHALVDEVPADRRKIVTDHDSLGYLAHEYGFDIVGTVVPSLSTAASASAQELAALEDQIRDEGVKAIFVGSTVNPQLADQVASDLGIQVVPIFTDSLSDANGVAPTYIDFMRHNIQTIVEALR